MPPGGDAIEEISSGCLAVRVRMLGRAVTAVYERALASRELSVAQMNILVFVGKQGPCPPAVVGQMLSSRRFGFMTMERDGDAWSMRAFDAAGKPIAACSLRAHKASCSPVVDLPARP